MFVELVERGITNRGKIVPIGAVGISPRDYEAYITLFPFDKSINNYVKTHGTIKDFKGQHSLLSIPIDIDNDNDLEGSRKSTLSIIERLNMVYNISPDELFIYYSGNKGFHVMLVDKLIGSGGIFYDSVGARCKSFIFDKFGDIPNIDGKIYEDHRIFRIPNSLHVKTNRYKVEITYEELKQGCEFIINLSKQPRFVKRRIAYSDIRVNRLLADDFSGYVVGTTIRTETGRVDVGFWGAMEKGIRNDGYYKQACALFTHSELSEKSILEIIYSINQSSREPLTASEIQTVVRSAYQKSKTKQIQAEQSERIYTFKDAVPLWLDSIKPEKNKLTLGFESFDVEMRGKLRGKVCDVIGYGGSKKSLYAQWVGYKNVLKKQRVLYSTMEMGIPDLMTRAINMSVEGERYSGALELEVMDKSNPQGVVDFLDNKIEKLFCDYLLMTDSVAMTAEKYDKLIENINQRTGLLDILIIDGLGMMGGNGTETERYSEATKELKDLAKKHNIFIILICHVSKGEERDSKDLSRAIRSSEKIIDNCDFYISLAQFKLIDVDGRPTYNNKYGNARLVNKRGSGAVIDQFFQLGNLVMDFLPCEENAVKVVGSTSSAF